MNYGTYESEVVNDGIEGVHYTKVEKTANITNFNGINDTADYVEIFWANEGAIVEDCTIKVNDVNSPNMPITPDIIIRGGYVDNGNAIYNTVNISNVTFENSAEIYGGVSGSVGVASFSENTRSNGTVTGNTVTINNIVTIKDTTFKDYAAIFGEYTSNNVDVTGNTVTIEDTTFNNEAVIFGGYTSGDGNVTGNTVEIIGNTTFTSASTSNIYGGYSVDGQANGNSVKISGGTFENIFGGYASSGTAEGNRVTINGGQFDANVYGGLGATAANGNSFIINDGTFNAWITGGDGSKAANGNIVKIDGGTINAVACGGYSQFGEAKKNSVIINAGTIKSYVYGGYADFASGKAIENSVEINGGTFNGDVDVRGGYSESGEATGNIVEINGGTFNGSVDVYGGYAGANSGEADGNSVSISGGTFKDIFGGWATSSSGKAEGNCVTINGGTITGWVKGGRGAETANENIVEINGGNFKGIYGGDGKTANGNSVEINGGNFSSTVFGGYGETANNNSVRISGGTFEGYVYGGNGYTANNNSVSISGGTITGNVYGGWANSESGTATANENSVIISGGNITGSVFGGYGKEAKNNKIVITKGDNFGVATSLVNANLYGSNLAASETSGNTLDISALTAATNINSINNFNTIIMGSGQLTLNEAFLTINGGSLNGTVITAGNLSGEGDLISGVSTTGVNVEALKGEAGKDKVTALSNGVQYAIAGGTAVTVNPTSIHVKADAPDTVKAVAGVFYGDDGKVEKGNTNGVLTLDGSVTPVEGVIYAGAYAKKGKASGGTVKLTGNFNGTVYGGYSADRSGTENNTLEIDGSKSVTVNKIESVDTINIIGKVAKNGEKATLNVTEKADFANANINIAGLVLEGAVKDTTTYNVISNAVVNAAKVAIDGLVKEENNVVKANIVNKDFTNGLKLTYGGKVVTGSYTDEAGTVTANGGVLKVSAIGAPEEGVIYAGAYSTKGVPNGAVDLDASFAGTLYGGYQAVDKKGTGTLNVRGKDLSVKEIANFNTINFFVPADLSKDGTVLKVENNVNIAGAKVNAGINNQSALDVGDEITLLEAASLDATGIVAGKVTENDFVDYDMNIEATNKQLKAKITSKGISNENSKSPVETIAGGLVMLNMGADQLAGKGFENAAEAVSLEKATAPNTMTSFASVGGNKVKAKTGSHVDLKGWNFNMGLAKEIDNKSGKLLIAPLAEYGRGSYDSYIDSGVHAEGTSKYWGAGVMARQTNNSGFYYEGSLVGGKSTNDYSTKDIGTGISYDTSAMYMNAHLGAGKIVELGEKDRLNYYGKFFYSRLGSDDVTLSNGAKYSFDASESKRVCLGGRWTRELDAMNKLYAGMAWQYEFDAESRATVNGKTAQAPTMKGHTGIFELGWNVKPNNAKFDIDMSFLGYTGKQKGGSLNVNMNWKF